MNFFSVAIDGPSGAGKSTIAKAVAKKLGLVYVDTGAMYRAIGLYMYKNGILGTDVDKVIPALQNVEVKLEYKDGAQCVILNGEDVSDKIRTPIISKYASDVSAIQAVRDFLLDLQRTMAKTTSVVMDGRDIGTVILPDAEVKIFLTACAQTRAERRYKELCGKNEIVTFDDVLCDMKTRDNNDSCRKNAPLKQADDAILVDSSCICLEETISIIENIIKRKIDR